MMVQKIQGAVKCSLNSTDRYTNMIRDVSEEIVHSQLYKAE